MRNKCEVCNKNEPVGVACVPGVPYSAAYCEECIRAKAHPIGILMAQCACAGRYDHCAEYFQQMVTDTCEHINYEMSAFLTGVQSMIHDMDSYEEPPEEEEVDNDT
jgi:pentatricopeptide repeat protein